MGEIGMMPVYIIRGRFNDRKSRNRALANAVKGQPLEDRCELTTRPPSTRYLPRHRKKWGHISEYMWDSSGKQ